MLAKVPSRENSLQPQTTHTHTHTHLVCRDSLLLLSDQRLAPHKMRPIAPHLPRHLLSPAERDQLTQRLLERQDGLALPSGVVHAGHAPSCLLLDEAKPV